MKIDVYPADRLSPDEIERWVAIQRAHKVFDNPFFRPEYVQLAARVLDNVEVAVMKPAGATVGLFPFERHAHDVGRPVGTILSDMHGVVTPQTCHWDATQLVRDSGLNAWQFDHLIASQQPFIPHHSFVDESPYIDLRGGFDAYRGNRQAAGSSVIRQAQRKGRKLDREIGPIRFCAHTTDPKVWAALVNWKRLQLGRQGYADLFRFDWVNALLEELRTVEGSEFSPLMSALYAGDQLLAVHLALRSHHVLSSWIPTHDDQFSKYSPGLVLHVELAKWAAENGIERIDLCRGENQMKSSLMSGSTPVAIGSVDRRLIRQTLARGYYVLRKLVYATPLRGAPLKTFRRIRNSISR